MNTRTTFDYHSRCTTFRYLPVANLGAQVVVVSVNVPEVRGFKSGRGRWIFKSDKSPWHYFLRRGSKFVGPMS
jgi:hypothetical protein